MRINDFTKSLVSPFTIGEMPLAIRKLGLVNVLKLLLSRRRFNSGARQPLGTIAIFSNKPPLFFRHATTDKYVIADVLVKTQYACLKGRSGVSWIVDAGANIGTTSVWLLNEYPEARLIAIEPDPSNFDVLERNLKPYGSRAICLNKALWSDSEELMVVHGGFRDGGEWAHRVCRQDLNVKKAAVAQGTTIGELMARYQASAFDILKIDIEGAEREVFAGQTEWLASVAAVAIELHDRECRDLFLKATAPYGGALSQHGETTLWQNNSESAGVVKAK